MSAAEPLDAEAPVVASNGMEFSPSLSSIAKALILAQGNMGEIRKDATNPHFRSRYASLPNVIDAVQPALQAAGIALLQGNTSGFSPKGDLIVNVETMLLHESGEYVRSRLALKPTKDDPQGVGSAITYGRRYGLLSMCGVAPDEDDDGNAASHTPRKPSGARETEPRVTTSTPPEARNEAATVQPAASPNAPGSITAETQAKLAKAFAVLSMTGIEIEAMYQLVTERRVSDPDGMKLLSENEGRRLAKRLAESECVACNRKPLKEPHVKGCPEDHTAPVATEETDLPL